MLIAGKPYASNKHIPTKLHTNFVGKFSFIAFFVFLNLYKQKFIAISFTAKTKKGNKIPINKETPTIFPKSIVNGKKPITNFIN